MVPATQTPLSPIEKLFLRIDNNVIRGIAFLDRPPDPAVLRRNLDSYAQNAVALRSRICLSPEPHLEQVPGFHGSHALRISRLSRSLSREDYLAMLTSCCRDYPEGDKPPWFFRLVLTDAAGSFAPAAILFAAHHALLDGIRAIHLFSALQGKRYRVSEMPLVPPPMPSPLVRWPANGLAFLLFSYHFLRGWLPPALPPDVKGDAPPSYAMATVSRQRIRELGRRFEGSTPAIYGLITRGILRMMTGRTGARRPFHAMFPLATHRTGRMAKSGNHLSWADVTLPKGEPARMIQALESSLRWHRLQFTAFGQQTMAHFFHLVENGLAHLGAQHVDNALYKALSQVPAVVSIIPGPARPFWISGARVTEIFGFVPVLHPKGISVGFFSNGGTVHLSVGYYPRHYPNASQLHAELHRLDRDDCQLLQ